MNAKLMNAKLKWHFCLSLCFLLTVVSGFHTAALAYDSTSVTDANNKHAERWKAFPLSQDISSVSIVKNTPEMPSAQEMNAKFEEGRQHNPVKKFALGLITQNVAPPGTNFMITDIHPSSGYYSSLSTLLGKTATATTCSGSNAGVTDPGINLLTAGSRMGWYDACFTLPGNSNQYYIYGFKYQLASSMTQNVAPPSTNFMITDIHPSSGFYSSLSTFLGKTATATTCSGSNAGVTDPGINLLTAGSRMGWYDACFTLPGNSNQYYIYGFKYQLVSATVVEFYNTNLDNYFITADTSEAAQIDNGSAGPGWSRTGNTFKSGGSASVCRFYGSYSPGPNSHFYTVDPAECQGLKDQQIPAGDPRKLTVKSWNFESLDFVSTPASNGTCPNGTTPVYRAYNNGFNRGVDSNHRITSSLTAIQEVLTRGWSNEGVVMCAPI